MTDAGRGGGYQLHKGYDVKSAQLLDFPLYVVERNKMAKPLVTIKDYDLIRLTYNAEQRVKFGSEC